MNTQRASYLKTVIICAAAGTSLAALAILGFVQVELSVAEETVLSYALPIIWYTVLGTLAVMAMLFLLVTLGGTICILRDVEKKRRG